MNVFQIHKLSNEEIISHVTDSPSSTKIEIELALRLANTQIDLLSLQNELDSFKSKTQDFMLENNITFNESEKLIKQLSQPEIDNAGILVRPQIKVE